MATLTVMKPKKSNQPVVEGLKKGLANLHALYLLTQNCHWNVTGIHFAALHTMLEDQYTDMATAIDDTAERIRALDSYAPGSLQQYKEDCVIKEIHQQETTEVMLKTLIAGHEQVVMLLRDVVRDAEEVHDDGTVDFLGTRIATHEKMLWITYLP